MKLYIHLENENIKSYKTHYITWFNYLLPFMEKYNVVNAKTPENSDIIIATLDKYSKIYNKTKFSDKKFIIIEQNDSCVVNINVLKSDNVIYVFKPHILNPLTLNNDFRLRGRRHLALLNNLYKIVDPINYRKIEYGDLINKIKCIVPHWFRYRELLNKKIIPIKDRKIDVYFSGTLKYHNRDPHLKIKRDEFTEKVGSLLTRHRYDTIDSINNLKYNGFASTGKLYYKDYISNIENSKIFVSPYGWGEFSHKDFEVTLLGCILIKPMSNNIQCYPNIYKDGVTCISCKLDYSDLQEKVDYLLKKPKVMDNINNNVRKLIDEFKNNKKCANDFYDLLKPFVK